MSDGWHGDQVLARLHAAQQLAIDEIMAACVIYAKQHHPGWKNISGFAEGSIRILATAQPDPAGGYSGQWGSAECDYMVWLELKHGSALRNAADILYPQLEARVAAHFQAAA